MKRSVTTIGLLLACLGVCAPALGDTAQPRARDLGIPFEGQPGLLNAITDVEGVTVGHVTLIENLPGGRAVRTGVSAILPMGRESLAHPVFAGVFSLNGNGEMTGTHWIDESGMLEGPVMLTNTHSVGRVHQGVIAWRVAADGADSSGYWWSLPVVAETWDGHLNDINGFHIQEAHAGQALEAASGGPVAEGNVGGGTGMITYEFKGGIGTSSRRVSTEQGEFTVGVLVQANSGARDQLLVAGIPVGQHLREHRVYTDEGLNADNGSIIIIVATDAPLLPHQLRRMARRAALGLARTGSIAGNGSGDIFIAFSTAQRNLGHSGAVMQVGMLPHDHLDPLFLGVVQATEESIVNAMVAARDMDGDQGRYAKAIPHEALQSVLRQHGRLQESVE